MVIKSVSLSLHLFSKSSYQVNATFEGSLGVVRPFSWGIEGGGKLIIIASKLKGRESPRRMHDVWQGKVGWLLPVDCPFTKVNNTWMKHLSSWGSVIHYGSTDVLMTSFVIPELSRYTLEMILLQDVLSSIFNVEILITAPTLGLSCWSYPPYNSQFWF